MTSSGGSTSNNNNDSTTCGFSASCTEACQSISNISLPSNELACLHPVSYFNLHNNPSHHDDENHDGHNDDYAHISGSGSPVMYSNHAPILRGMGFTKCEYCGSSSVDKCQGVQEVHDHFYEYQQKMFGGQFDTNGGGTKDGEDHFQSAAQQHSTTTSTNNNNHDNDANSTSSQNSSPQLQTCHRPKLFFLKKRPPFANSHDGWNIQTQHRQQLFEPPSSMEGVGRGYGEVRGQLGDYCTVNYASPRNTTMNNGLMSMKNGYKIFSRSKSMPVRATNGGGLCNDACGSVCGETEISFLSASGTTGRRSPMVRLNNNNGGNYNNSNNNGNGGNNDSDTGRSLSPLQWVNGSEIKGVMNWFA
jgi:hypothetical protein